jgi:hypothetical protein
VRRAKLSWLMLLLGAAAVITLLLFVRYSTAVEVDSCLDRGGRFDYATHVCELSKAPAQQRP